MKNDEFVKVLKFTNYSIRFSTGDREAEENVFHSVFNPYGAGCTGRFINIFLLLITHIIIQCLIFIAKKS